MAYTRRGFLATAKATTLASDAGIGATSLTVTTGGLSTWSGIGTNGPFTVTINRGKSDEETTTATGISSSTITGVTATTIAHVSGATVEHTSSATDFDEANKLVAQANTWTAYTPSYSGLGSMTVVEAAHSSNHRRYLTVGKLCLVSFSQLLTYGGTRQASLQISLPVAAAKPRQSFSGDIENAVARCTTADDTATVFMSTYDGHTIAAGDYHTSFHGWYEIA